MRRRMVRTMERQKKKHPCSGCVWRVQTSEDKVLCMFPPLREKRIRAILAAGEAE